MQEDTKPRAQTSRDDSESFETQQPLARLCSVLSRPDLERIVGPKLPDDSKRLADSSNSIASAALALCSAI